MMSNKHIIIICYYNVSSTLIVNIIGRPWCVDEDHSLIVKSTLALFYSVFVDDALAFHGEKEASQDMQDLLNCN